MVSGTHLLCEKMKSKGRRERQSRVRPDEIKCEKLNGADIQQKDSMIPNLNGIKQDI